MAKTLYLPEIGDELKLTKDWAFDLFDEYRNSGLWKQVTGNESSRSYRDKMTSVPVTLPKGTILAVDRIYIRKGAADFSSLSFRIVSHADWKKEKNSFGSKHIFRFWAKLKDCNTIEFEQVKDATKEIKITKWDYNLRDVQRNGYNSFLGGQNNPASDHIEGFGYIKDEKVIKMIIDYDIKWDFILGGRSLLGFRDTGYWTSKVKNVKYKVQSIDGTELGIYNTFSTAKSIARKFIQKSNENE